MDIHMFVPEVQILDKIVRTSSNTRKLLENYQGRNRGGKFYDPVPG
jgi:hypothetical protein